jgi:molybdopterin converting factor small subunit
VQVTVKFLGALRDQVGVPSLAVGIPAGGTYRDFLDAIEATVTAKLADWAWDSGRRSFSRRMMISLNGTADVCDQGTVLREGDEILVVLPLAGG